VTAPFSIRPAAETDRPWLRQFMRDHWGAEVMVAGGRSFYPAEHPAFLAEQEEQIVGVVTYEFHRDECEITSINTHYATSGIGTALIEHVAAEARAHDCRRVWLITTNDNLNALRFYQKRGFRLAALYPGAVDESRKIKPQIPLVGENGIPLRDEIKLELALDAAERGQGRMTP
jgi:N-acetylglutamate synthase-like GNAT family acetyltransferase